MDGRSYQVLGYLVYGPGDVFVALEIVVYGLPPRLYWYGVLGLVRCTERLPETWSPLPGAFWRAVPGRLRGRSITPVVTGEDGRAPAAQRGLAP